VRSREGEMRGTVAPVDPKMLRSDTNKADFETGPPFAITAFSIRSNLFASDCFGQQRVIEREREREKRVWSV
jgi:hypothetical protein